MSTTRPCPSCEGTGIYPVGHPEYDVGPCPQCESTGVVPTVDSNARRQAILFEVAAVATRYEQDAAPESLNARLMGIAEAHNRLCLSLMRGRVAAVTELAGRCVAWLEHLAEMEAKA
jgi:hypothetical protein